MTNLDEFLKEAQTVGIGGHVHPDGDCIGSCLAVYNYIKLYYPQITTDVYLEPIPNVFKFLARAEEICSDAVSDKSYDLFIALDCGDVKRLGAFAPYCENAKKNICIDHHVSNTGFAAENYIYPDASSTSELIYDLLPKERITKELAACIYTGIIHDTGVFKYSCTSQKTMEAAGALMALGIDYTKIVDDTYYVKTYNQNRIGALAVLKSKLHLDGRCISAVLTAEEMRAYEVLPKHLDGIVNQLQITKGVEAAIFLYEMEDGFKASLRSRRDVDVARIALSYGGGGHVRAAGCTISGNPDAIVEELVVQISAQL